MLYSLSISNLVHPTSRHYDLPNNLKSFYDLACNLSTKSNLWACTICSRLTDWYSKGAPDCRSTGWRVTKKQCWRRSNRLRCFDCNTTLSTKSILWNWHEWLCPCCSTTVVFQLAASDEILHPRPVEQTRDLGLQDLFATSTNGPHALHLPQPLQSPNYKKKSGCLLRQQARSI